MKKIVVLGANPAWQKTLNFAKLQVGEVNRAQSCSQYPSGKGINFSRAAHCYGATNVVVLQFAGGATGKRLEEALMEQNIVFKSASTTSETRTCTTLLDNASGNMTELIEPSVTPSEAEQEDFLQLLETELIDASALALCGTLPGTMSSVFYDKIMKIALNAPKLEVLVADLWQHAETILHHQDPRVRFKVSGEELFRIATAPTIPEALTKLLAQYPALEIGVTVGGDRAFYRSQAALTTYTPACLSQIVNPLGSGDTVSAVYTVELLRGTPGPEAFRRALAAGSANCLSATAGEFSPTKSAELLLQIRAF